MTEGECTVGTLWCRGGEVQCVGGRMPEREICDGLDNDCDGTVDEDPLSCDGELLCVRSPGGRWVECAPPCEAGTFNDGCPTGTRCETVASSADGALSARCIYTP